MIIIIIICLILTYYAWKEENMGLNIFGLCGFTFLRPPLQTAPFVGLIIGQAFVLLGIGIFAIIYFKKHYPDTIGLRSKRKYLKQLLIIFVVGYFLFYITTALLNILLYFNCYSSDPK